MALNTYLPPHQNTMPESQRVAGGQWHEYSENIQILTAYTVTGIVQHTVAESVQHMAEEKLQQIALNNPQILENIRPIMKEIFHLMAVSSNHLATAEDYQHTLFLDRVRQLVEESRRMLETSQKIVAQTLLKIGAVQIDESAPFTLTSGKQSPLYVDVRRLLSYPLERDMIMDRATTLLESQLPQLPDMTIAGGESAGIPFASLLTQRLKSPLIYVRKQPKKVGLQKNIEGDLNPDRSILLVEDILTQGTSKALFINRLREEGGQINDVFIPITYQNEEQESAFAKTHDVKVHSLSRVSVLLDVAQEEQTHSHAAITAARQWLADL